MSKTAQADLLLAATEAINNACEHAGPAAHVVQISCSRSLDRVSISVADNGGGFILDPVAWQREPPLDQTGGRGLFLMHQLADDVTITPTRRGTRVTLVRDKAPI